MPKLVKKISEMSGYSAWFESADPGVYQLKVIGSNSAGDEETTTLSYTLYGVEYSVRHSDRIAELPDVTKVGQGLPLVLNFTPAEGYYYEPDNKPVIKIGGVTIPESYGWTWHALFGSNSYQLRIPGDLVRNFRGTTGTTIEISNIDPTNGKETYTITTILTGVTADSSNPTEIGSDETATLMFTENDDYEMPESVTVNNADVVSWQVTES